LRIADCGFNRKERNAASRNQRHGTTDFTDFTDKELLVSKSPPLFPIREIREIRGKIFAIRSDFEGLHCKKAQKAKKKACCGNIIMSIDLVEY
jgi:hypothetical protein